jgi:hypothetical protein
MKERAWATLGCVALAATVAAGSGAAEDDLDLVRRAVARDETQAAPSRPALEAAPARRGVAPRWLKVRVVDKGDKKARVSVNVPLALVHALGDDWTVDGRCRARNAQPKGERCPIRIADVLRALETGQEIVEIDDDEAHIRVWLE